MLVIAVPVVRDERKNVNVSLVTVGVYFLLGGNQ